VHNLNDIVTILNNIFAYISPETGWIWTKLGTVMGLRKDRTYKIFGRIAPSYSYHLYSKRLNLIRIRHIHIHISNALFTFIIFY